MTQLENEEKLQELNDDFFSVMESCHAFPDSLTVEDEVTKTVGLDISDGFIHGTLYKSKIRVKGFLLLQVSFEEVHTCCGLALAYNLTFIPMYYAKPSEKEIAYRAYFEHIKDISRLFGYSQVMFTHNESHYLPYAEKQGFKIVSTFLNKRTGNPVSVLICDI